TDFIDTCFSGWKPGEADPDTGQDVDQDVDQDKGRDANQDLACLAFLADELCRKMPPGHASGNRAPSSAQSPFKTLGHWTL
ncbi:MAG: hypothetical protein MI747_24600, partial [Desulfobacterales bacterium]|nr:hypothetical protein [Desulfobacterales bacterium]